MVQNVPAASMSRFGTTISQLADLNGDGLRDVAVGAPLEDDSRGAVYIYLGDKRSGIRSTFSQVRPSAPRFRVLCRTSFSFVLCMCFELQTPMTCV